MKKFYFTIFLMSFGGLCNSQNLVLNGDFEQYSGCPTYFNQIDSALHWMNPCIVSSGGGSPDYFNSCSAFNGVSIPENHEGYQSARSGDAYCGIMLKDFTMSNYREYAEGQLKYPLEKGAHYRFEMYISAANRSQFSTDAIGVYFSDTSINGITNAKPLPFTPQIVNPSVHYLYDTLNWVLVTVEYLAHGGENYFIIGNFKNDTNTSTLLTNTSGIHKGCYVYIDDVSLTHNTGIGEQENNAIISIFPNPASDHLNIVLREKATIELLNINGQIIKTYSNDNYRTSLDLTHLSGGVYMVRIKTDKEIAVKKFIKN